jgi:hypothetical protein
VESVESVESGVSFLVAVQDKNKYTCALTCRKKYLLTCQGAARGLLLTGVRFGISVMWL